MSLGEQVLQIYDELRSYPLLKKRGYETCDLLGDVLVDSRSGTASFRLNAKRYTFRCFDFFISGLAGGLRSIRLGLFDQDGKQLFDGTLPGHFEVFHSDEWVADFTALHSQIVLLVGKRRIRDPSGRSGSAESSPRSWNQSTAYFTDCVVELRGAGPRSG